MEASVNKANEKLSGASLDKQVEYEHAGGCIGLKGKVEVSSQSKNVANIKP